MSTLDFEDSRSNNYFGGDAGVDEYLQGVWKRAQARINPEYRNHASLAPLNTEGVFSVTNGSQRQVLKLMDPHFAGSCDSDFDPRSLSGSEEERNGRKMLLGEHPGVNLEVVDQKSYDKTIFGGKKSYEILGIMEGTPLPDARKQYLRLTNNFHPDRPWKRRGAEFDILIDKLKEIGLLDENENSPWMMNWHDPGLQDDGGGYMSLYCAFLLRVISGKITYEAPDLTQRSLEKAQKAHQVLDEYIGVFGHRFYQICKAYELFEQGFGSLDIFGSYLTWTHHYRIALDQFEQTIIEGSVIELPETRAKIFVPILWILRHESNSNKVEEEVHRIEDIYGIRLTEGILTFDTIAEDQLFNPGSISSRPYIPFESRIFDIVGIYEWYSTGTFSESYIQALRNRFPKIDNPEKIMSKYLSGEITDDTLQSEYDENFSSIATTIVQRGSYGMELTENGELLFFQNNITLRLSKEDIEILRFIALNLNLIRQSILMQLGLNN